MERQDGAHATEKMAEVLGVSRSGYYRYCTKGPSQREQNDANYCEQIKRLFELSRETYGSERMRSELAKKGLNLSKRRIIRLMKVVNLVPKKRRFFKQTTKVDNRLPVADNKLEQQFKAARPNEKWVSDISYVFTQEGWLYVAAILDLFSRKLIGLAMDKYLRTELVSRAFKQALLHRRQPKELLHHSDSVLTLKSSFFNKKFFSYTIHVIF
ncbi:MAG: hypothetical protein A3E87_04100 [Gammaproteobacteria bacterium RIFCSPHIGHO2_12_FULL_35_23]|nr:MAG: hypothetical protein A3E87_04100 [Gammaproteobacteria bacterium RIFCSPHIGHO2_12_FULL_35_23]